MSKFTVAISIKVLNLDEQGPLTAELTLSSGGRQTIYRAEHMTQPDMLMVFRKDGRPVYELPISTRNETFRSWPRVKRDAFVFISTPLERLMQEITAYLTLEGRMPEPETIVHLSEYRDQEEVVRYLFDA